MVIRFKILVKPATLPLIEASCDAKTILWIFKVVSATQNSRNKKMKKIVCAAQTDQAIGIRFIYFMILYKRFAFCTSLKSMQILKNSKFELKYSRLGHSSKIS